MHGSFYASCLYLLTLCLIRHTAQEAVKQIASFGDPAGIGAKLMAKMGFGAAGGAGLGTKEQVR